MKIKIVQASELKDSLCPSDYMTNDKKRFVVELFMDTGKTKAGGVVAMVYIESVNVRKVSHERIEADGIIIDLPGNISNVEALYPVKYLEDV